MSGVSHITSIFKDYSEFKLGETPGGTPICTFTNPKGVGTTYANGYGYAMTGGYAPIAHDKVSLEKFIQSAYGLSKTPVEGIEVWETALQALKEKVLARDQLPLKIAC